jgi:hypothetical protein
MRKRCGYRGYRGFHRYGGRGIRVHAAWQDDFQAFFEHVGPRPSPKHTLDRIRNNEGYEPGNVRWATRKDQARNRSDNKLASIDVEFIRHWASKGFRGADIAAAFGVRKHHVYGILSGEKWA